MLSDSGMCFVRYCYLKKIIFFYLFHQLLGQNSQFTIRLTVIYDTRRRDERHFISINVNVNYQLIAKHMTGLRNYVFCDWNPGYVVFIKGIAQICLNFQFHSYIRLHTYIRFIVVKIRKSKVLLSSKLMVVSTCCLARHFLKIPSTFTSLYIHSCLMYVPSP